jgi:anaerobic selenocysteine-containing dehydrogenase
VHHPDRLTHPLRKTANGFERISWDEALDTIATRLLDIREKYGSHTLIRCGGAPVSSATSDAFLQMTAAYGSLNVAGASHLCSIPRMMALSSLFGSRTGHDYFNTKCIILWGSNPTESRSVSEGSISYGNVSKVIPDAVKRGAKLIVIDPRRIKLVDIADKWLRPEPGTDAALALAMLHVIIKEELYDKQFVKDWTIGFDELAEHVKGLTPEWAENITKVPAADIREVARMYATIKPGIIRDGNFADQATNTVQTMRAVGSLIAVCGNIDVKGGDVFFSRLEMPFLAQRLGTKLLSADDHPLFPKVPIPVITDAIITGKPYKPRAMIVYHGNPLLINANTTRNRQALEHLDFLVVCDIFMSATAQVADIILPDVTEYENYGVRSKASADGSGAYVCLQNKVIEPIGQTRPIFEVEYDLAKKMGLDKEYPWTNTEECIDHKLKLTGLTLAHLKKQPVVHIAQPKEYKQYLQNGFKTVSKKVELYSQPLKDHGYSPLPIYIEPYDKSTDDQYPLIGTSRRPGTYTHTRFRNIPSLVKLEPDPILRINPNDAKTRDISNGDDIIVKSVKGTVELKAKVTDETAAGVVIMDFGWGNPSDGKANLNVLTSDDVRDKITGSTPNRRFRCQVSKA